MAELEKHSSTQRHPKTPARILRKIFLILGLSVTTVVVAAVIFLCAMTAWLTPANLTRLINTKASEFLDADIRVKNARFTFWSTFPHFDIQIDSVSIISRTLRHIPKDLRKRLPADCDTLFLSGNFRGGINVYRLLRGEIRLRNVKITDPSLNIVAVNDSVNNYDIIHSLSESDYKIPRFSANVISAINPRPIRYFSLLTDSRFSASLAGLSIRQSGKKTDTYALLIEGSLDARINGFQILTRFPFRFMGDAYISFQPFGLKLNNLAIDFGNTKGKLNLDLDIGDEIRINNLDYNIKPFYILNILPYLPENYGRWISRIKTDLNLAVSASLTGPYTFSPERLPSFEINFRTDPGYISYIPASGTPFAVSCSEIDARLIFNGGNPRRSSLSIPRLRLSAPGVLCDADIEVSDPIGKPHVGLSASYDIDLRSLSRLSFMSGSALKGHISGNLQSSLSVREDSLPGNIQALFNGNFIVSGYSYFNKTENLLAEGDLLKSSFKGYMSASGFSTPPETFCQAVVSSDANSLSSGPGRHLYCGSLKARICASSISGSRSLALRLNASADSLYFRSPADSIQFSLRNYNLQARMDDSSKKNLHIASSYGNFRILTHGNSFCLSSGKLTAHARCKDKNSLRPEAPDFHGSFPDSASLGRITHTPPFLTFPSSDIVKNFINTWDIGINISNGSSTVLLKGFPQTIIFGPNEIQSDLDNVIVKKFSACAGSSQLALSGSVGNLRRILNFSEPSIIPVKINALIDTLDINRLARIYELGSRLFDYGNIRSIAKSEKTTSADTTTLLLPRNIRASVRASARQAIYTNLQFEDIAAGIRMDGGNALIDSLRLATDFGRVGLRIRYKSDDCNNIGVSADLSAHDINILRFFRKFPAILDAAPWMKNLTGFISADCNAAVKIYPNMYIEIPSLVADLDVKGRKLNLHQTRFIRRITKMMLIPYSSDIHIDDIDIKAHVHDNLLEIYPFRFIFANYDLLLGGLNNFSGRLYYHIGILKNPLPIPFGINILGNFSNPILRFGGPSFKTKNAVNVTSQVESTAKVNLIKEVGYGLKVFVHKAAQSDTLGN